MPRNGSGSYTLPEAAFVPNTAISSSAVNSDFSDIADALTDSLARDGQGGMTAVLPLANAGFTYSTDPNTGMRRTAADTQAISCGAVDVASFTSTGASVTGTLAVSSTFTVGGALLLPIGLGPLPWSGLTAPTKWLLCYGQSLLRASYPDLWTFASAEIAAGNTLFTNGNGTTTFTLPDFRGRGPAGKDDMGGSAASRLTATYFGTAATVLGAASTTTDHITLGTANLPAYTPAGTNSTSVSTVSNIVTSNAILSSNAAGGANNQLQPPSSIGAITVGAQTFTGTAQGGTSTPFSSVQPTIITNYIIYAGV